MAALSAGALTEADQHFSHALIVPPSTFTSHTPTVGTGLQTVLLQSSINKIYALLRNEAETIMLKMILDS